MGRFFNWFYQFILLLVMLGTLYYGYAKMALVQKTKKLAEIIFSTPRFFPVSATPRDAP